jgi:nicotinamide mononucleotide (NMN) deamidase PncC
MTRDDSDVVWKSKDLFVNRANELLRITAGKIRPAHGASEECVAGEEQGLLGKIEADAALSVAGRVEDGPAEA